jgi:hypothetical protein
MRGVTVELAAKAEPASVFRLSDGAALPFSWDAGRLNVDIDELGFFEAVKIVASTR